MNQVMPKADPLTYLYELTAELAVQWPKNRTVNILCHGHSVPAGYFATPYVNPFGAYPHLLHRIIKERFPFAVVNVIVTAIGGENAVSGAARFESDVLSHRPDVVVIDYALNDLAQPIEVMRAAWAGMIEAALAQGAKVIACTPTWDNTYYTKGDAWERRTESARQIRCLADERGIGLCDSFAVFERYVQRDEQLTELLSHVNHPTELGHTLVARELGSFFPAL